MKWKSNTVASLQSLGLISNVSFSPTFDFGLPNRSTDFHLLFNSFSQPDSGTYFLKGLRLLKFKTEVFSLIFQLKLITKTISALFRRLNYKTTIADFKGQKIHAGINFQSLPSPKKAQYRKQAKLVKYWVPKGIHTNSSISGSNCIQTFSLKFPVFICVCVCTNSYIHTEL